MREICYYHARCLIKSQKYALNDLLLQINKNVTKNITEFILELLKMSKSHIIFASNDKVEKITVIH